MPSGESRHIRPQEGTTESDLTMFILQVRKLRPGAEFGPGLAPEGISGRENLP